MQKSEVFRISAEQLGLIEHVAGAPRAVLNIPTRIDLESEIDEEKALEAMRLTVTRIPYCTLRMHELKDGTFEQYYWYGEPEGIEVVDMSTKSDDKVDSYILKLAKKAFDNDCNDSQLYSFKLIRRKNGKHTIYFCGYHLIMDTYGVMFVISYFDKVYYALTHDTPLPEPTVGPEKNIEDSWKYKGSEKEKRDIEWWCSQFDTEPHFSSMNPAPSKEYVKGKNYGKALTMLQMKAVSLPLRVPSELVQKVMDSALANNLSPQIYYALALRTYLSLNSGSDDVTVATTGARRATVYMKKCGMTPAHMVSWRSIIPQSCTFNEALRKLSITQKDIYKHIDVDMADYVAATYAKHNTPKDAIYKSVVFTYQPYFNIENINLKFSAEHVNIGITPYPLYLNLMPKDGSGDLWADYIYSSGYLKTENIEKFHNFMLKFIPAGIDSPEKTVEQLVQETF